MQKKEEIQFENIWSRYGLKDSPYNTKALSLIGNLNIEKVFCGRQKELKLIGDRIFSSESSRTAIVGEVGTGKTTFANHLRWQLSRKKNIKETRYLTTIEEIKIRDYWNFNSFLRETLFEIYNSSQIFKWDEEGIKLKTLKIIKNNLNIFEKKSFEIREDGIKLSKKENLPNQHIPSEILQSWFCKLCEEIRGYGKELILHYNNLESISSENLGNLFMSIKEIMQISGTHWLFLGDVNILSVIENIPQIHSIFNQHLFLEPLSKEEILLILKKRCEFLSEERTKYIQPYDELTVLELYNKLSGNIRFIFKLLEDTTSYLSSLSSSACKVNINEINIIQEKEKDKILEKLTDNQRKVIILLMDNEEMTLGELADRLEMKHQNLSKEIKELKKRILVMVKENPEDKRSKIVKLSQKIYLSFIFSRK